MMWKFIACVGWVVAAAAMAALLTACAGTPPVRTVVQEVKVPVAVQPIRADQVPAMPAPLPPRPKSLSAAADVLLAGYCEMVAYALRADPLLRLSAGEKAVEAPQFPECEPS